jgi:hypothetical protein
MTPKKNQKELVTINANDALIVTNGQSGGSNTVNLNQIPQPDFLLDKKSVSSKTTKEIINNDYDGMTGKPTIFLPSEGYNYDSVFKTEFVFSYNSSVKLSQIICHFKKDDVVFYEITSHLTSVGSSMIIRPRPVLLPNKQPGYLLKDPENGAYAVTVYSVSKFNPLKDFAIIFY